MKLLDSIHQFLFKRFNTYGYVVPIPSDSNWEMYIQRVLGGSSGIHGDPKNEYRVTRSFSEFAISDDIRSWSIENQIKIKFHITVDNRADYYPRNRHINLSFIFLTKAEAAQFKLTFL